MADAVDEPDAGPSLKDERKRIARLPRPSRAERASRHEAIIAFALAEKKRDSIIQYNELSRRIRERFRCSVNTAERAIAAANEQIRKGFERFCAEAPRIIFDSYMELHREHMLRSASSQRERDRVMHLANARRNLDSVRDMFGLRSAIEVNVNLGNVVPANAFGELTDAQVDALALLDSYEAPKALDVPSIEQSIDLAGVAIDAIEDDDGDDVDEP